jgi:formiminotetrahydrofolate cyclodeaminase
MVCNLTLGREKYASVEPEVRRLLDRAEAVRTRLRSNVQADAAAYEGVMAAYRLPRGSDEEKERRGAAIESATRFASEIPLLVAQDCEAVLAMSEEAIGRTNPNVNSDVAAAALLARSGLEAAAASVEINIPTLKDRGLAQELRERLAALRSGLEDRVAVVVERSREHPG